MMYAQIIVDVAHAKVDRLFDYRCGGEIQVGQRVLVPFGRSNRLIEGFVLGLHETITYPDSKVKDVQHACEPYPVLTENQIHTAYAMQQAYGCTLADALRLMLPARLHGLHEKTQLFVRLISRDAHVGYTKTGAVKAPIQQQIIDALNACQDGLFLHQLNERFPGCDASVRGLEKKGIVSLGKKQVERTPYAGAIEEAKAIALNPEQQAAVEAIKPGGAYLLHGITGSGKTEVYIRLIGECLKRKAQAIVLVPEIALTPQAVERYRSRFGEQVAVMHSQLSAGERFDQWKRCLTGEASIALGPRSAVFAPFRQLGLIIIDEEHESSYQSDTFPRYDAREVAKFRLSGDAVLLLGSATPSMETYDAAQRGEYTLLTLTKRANQQPMPKVYFVDMREEIKAGNKMLVSNLLYEKIKATLEKKEQVMLLLNKRGYASFVMCRGCGHVMHCPHCDVSLAYHKSSAGKVTCHYCGYEEKITRTCPNCGKPYLKYFGVGTQQVEEQVSALFPGARIARMDHDTTRGKDAHLHLFQSFMAGEYDILVGTQMIAKGLDFPKVTLVGIISADNMLNLPDYRAHEKTFQLVTQASGRSGRGERPGEVVIQTYIPQSPSLMLAVRQDYTAFYQEEMRIRKRTQYPPFGLFIRILVLSKQYDAAYDQLKELNLTFRPKAQELGEDLLLFSCSSAPISRISDTHRFQVLIKLKNTERARAWAVQLQQEVKEYPTGKNVLLDFERNPKNML